MPIAAIDVGTNTAKLVVADLSEDGSLNVVADARRFVRLGEGVDKTGCIQPAALARLVLALRDLRGIAEDHDAESIVIGATSASRDAQNGDDLVETVRREVGLDYTILSGQDEAAFAFAGALSSFPHLAGTSCVVVDIGGGSTEIVGGTYGQRALDFGLSVDVGSVRVTERFFTSQPPPASEQGAAEAFVRQELDVFGVPYVPERTMVGAAGTTGSLARMHLRFAEWNERKNDPATLYRSDVQAWRHRLASLTFDEVMALNPKVMKGRADIFLAGMIVLDETMGRLGQDRFFASPRGLRHGIALHALGVL